MIRLAIERGPHPTAVIMDGRTLQSTPESGARAGFDGHKKKHGSKVYVAVDTLRHLLTLISIPANQQERAQVAALAQNVQEVVPKCPGCLRGSRLHWRRRRSGGERTRNPLGSCETHRSQTRLRAIAPAMGRGTHFFGWLGRFRHLARDYERLAKTLKGWHWVAALTLFLQNYYRST